MSSGRVPSPARSEGMKSPLPRRSRRTKSVCSATSNNSVRLSTVIQDSFQLSPVPNRKSVLSNETDIQIPGRQSWWRRISENSRNVTDIMEERGFKTVVKVTNVAEEFDVEILSQENENMSVNLPDSSDGESIHSIVIPQRKIFTNQDNRPQKKSKEIVNDKENFARMQKSYFDQTNIDQDINVMPKKLFNQGKPKTKPVFTAALLNASANKTVNKTTKESAQEIQGQVRNLFGNRLGAKRKNVFSAFLLSDSEDTIPDIQPTLFGFPKKIGNHQISKQRRSRASQSSVHSTISNMTDAEMDEWQHLPSSTMVEHQLEAGETTPLKNTRLRLSKPGPSISQDNSINKSKKSNKYNSKIIHTEAEDLNVINTRSQSLNKSKNNSKLPNNNKSRNETSVKKSSKQMQDISADKTFTEENMLVDLVNEENEKTFIEENQYEEDIEDDENFTLVYENDDEQIIDNHQEQNTIETEKQETEQEIIVKNLHEKKESKKTNESHKSNNSNSKEIHTEPEELNIINTGSQSLNNLLNNSYLMTKNDKSLNKTLVKNSSENVLVEQTLTKENVQDLVNEENEKTLIEENHDNDDEQIINGTVRKEYNEQKQNFIDKENQQIEQEDDQTRLENENEQGNQDENRSDQQEIKGNKEDKDKDVNEYNQSDANDNILDDTNPKENVIIEPEQSYKDYDQQLGSHKTKDHEDKQNCNDIFNDNTKITKNSREQTNSTHDTTERFRKDKHGAKSPEPVLHDGNNREESLTSHGQNTSISKSKTMTKELNVRASLAPSIESTDLIDGTLNSSSDRSSWDSHRTTRQTLRQTFGKDFTPRKSLRTLIMERSAKRQTNHKLMSDKSKRMTNFNEVADKSKRQDNFNDITSGTIKMPIANSTEYPDFDSYQDQDEEVESDKEQDQDEEVEFYGEQEQIVLESNRMQVEELALDIENKQVEKFASNKKQEIITEFISNMEQDKKNTSDIEQEAVKNNEEEQNEEFETDRAHPEESESERDQEQRDEFESNGDQEEGDEFESDREQEEPEEIESDEDQEVEEIESNREEEEVEEFESDREQEQNEESESDKQDEVEEVESDGEQQEVTEFLSDREKGQDADFESDEEQEEVTELESDDEQEKKELESIREPKPLGVDETMEESDHKVSRQSRMNTLETYLLKVKQENAEKRRKMQEQVMNSLKMARKPYNPFKMPEIPKQNRATKTIKKVAKTKIKPSAFSSGMLPPEFLEDMKYKPPKRFQGKNAPWITKRLYKYLEDKLEPKYDYRARVRAEKLVEKLYHFSKEVRKLRVAPPAAIAELKHEMARLGIVKTHYDFYCFFHEFMPREIRIRVNPDILNKIPAPQRVFADILEDDS